MMSSLPRRSYSALALASLSGGSLYSVVTVAEVCAVTNKDDTSGVCANVFCETKLKQSTSSTNETSSFIEASLRDAARNQKNGVFFKTAKCSERRKPVTANQSYGLRSSKCNWWSR